jgi:hypothetical protein
VSAVHLRWLDLLEIKKKSQLIAYSCLKIQYQKNAELTCCKLYKAIICKGLRIGGLGIRTISGLLLSAGSPSYTCVKPIQYHQAGNSITYDRASHLERWVSSGNDGFQTRTG